MKLVKLIEFLRNRLKLLVRLSFGLLGLLILVDAVCINKEHAHTQPEHWPAFWSVFGFIACALIIYVSKWFGHSGIMTREDYYDE
jgi:hypothetical protein